MKVAPADTRSLCVHTRGFARHTSRKSPISLSGKELLTFGGHTQTVWDAVWSPDGKRIATSDFAGNVKVWDASTGQEAISFKGPGPVRSLDWSADGHYLLVAGAFNTPFIRRVWQSTDELIQHAKECCVVRELTAAERDQFGLAAK